MEEVESGLSYRLHQQIIYLLRDVLTANDEPHPLTLRNEQGFQKSFHDAERFLYIERKLYLSCRIICRCRRLSFRPRYGRYYSQKRLHSVFFYIPPRLPQCDGGCYENTRGLRALKMTSLTCQGVTVWNPANKRLHRSVTPCLILCGIFVLLTRTGK